jgi:radical SAM superfamily enzyme YgiQ (UPF0313 family)
VKNLASAFPNAPRVTLINPPFRRRVMRRYVASYFAPNFLLPPVDLLYVSSAANKLAGAQTTVIDAVAKSMTTDQAAAAIAATNPDVTFFQLGFATLEDDLKFCDRIRAETGVPAVAMGYLPTMFGKDLLEKTSIDAFVTGEPEIVFSELLGAWKEERSVGSIPGVIAREGDVIVIGPEPERIADLDALPMPDHAAVDLDDYNEPLLGKPVGAIFTGRGCPFSCTFCVRTFGKKLALRSAASVVEEARYLVRELGVKNLRIMDDTFNVDVKRAMEICEGFEKIGGFRWTALARLKPLDEKLVAAMKKSGCRRLYVGMESGSDRLLKLYKKGITVDAMRKSLATIKRYGIEVSAFFIVGGPDETREEFEASLALAKETKLDYVIVTRMQYWPGTELFEKTEGIELSLLPFYCRPADKASYDKLLDLEREFYRRFYLRPSMIFRQLAKNLTNIGQLAAGFAQVLRYVRSRFKEDLI